VAVLSFGDDFVGFLEVAQDPLSVPDGDTSHVGDTRH
jgi:hypothetical protein